MHQLLWHKIWAHSGAVTVYGIIFFIYCQCPLSSTYRKHKS
uniref:Uncharacterized protein n=1 Tax=Anguilla anguilla TaxID=7936 RepID=A0A0E9V5H5_ANGAN